MSISYFDDGSPRCLPFLEKSIGLFSQCNLFRRQELVRLVADRYQALWHVDGGGRSLLIAEIFGVRLVHGFVVGYDENFHNSSSIVD